MTVEQFLQQRFLALNNGDFAAVYASYHAESPFLQQFTDCNTYVDYAKQHLSGVNISYWTCLMQRTVAHKQEEAVLVMEVATDNGKQYFYELALLLDTAAGWRYHSAQKLSVEDYSGDPQLLDFSYFDDASQKIRF